MFQSSVFNKLVTKFHENKLAHAYLIETNNLDATINDIKKFLKIINCPQNYQEECSSCNLCNLINLNNLPSIKLIEPDGTSIKKKDIINLKEDFNSVPLYSKYNTYIIKNAEKLNASSANSMLKFIEEPTPGILGFFLTNNKDIIMDTIKSRCESYTVNYPTKSIQESLNINDEIYQKYLLSIKNYWNYLTNSSLINNKNNILKEYPERQDIENILKIIFAIYYHTFLKLNNQKYDEELIKMFPTKDNISKINQKLAIITEILTNMSYNVSIELILDKFVLEMRGLNE